MEETVSVIPSAAGDPRMATLADALHRAELAVIDFRGALKNVNRQDLQIAAAPAMDAADALLRHHLLRPSPTIADDVAIVLAAFKQFDIPAADAEFGRLPNLVALRGARGNIREDFGDVLQAASAMGWRPSRQALPDIGSTEVSRDGLDTALRGLVKRMEAVEQLLDQVVRPEGVRTPDRSLLQISLVNVFIKNVKLELFLAKISAQIRGVVDLLALGRAIENVAILTADFVASVRGMATKMTATLRDASEQLRPRVRKVAGGFKVVVRRVASSFARHKRKATMAPSVFPGFEGLMTLSQREDVDIRPTLLRVLTDLYVQSSTHSDDEERQFIELSSRLIDQVDDVTRATVRARLSTYPSTPAEIMKKLGLQPLGPGASANEQLPSPSPVEVSTQLWPPYEFNLDVVHRLILSGQPPPPTWRPWIEQLDFVGERLEDLTPLTDLTALQRLHLNGVRAGDLSPLAGLTALQELYLNYATVSDLSPLAGLTALQRLELQDTEVSDLAPLARLTALQSLDLSGATQVSDLRPLAGLTALQGLYLRDTQVTDLVPLAGLTALQELYLGRVPISNLMPLAALTALQKLYINSTLVVDLSPLARLTALRVLYLNSTGVIDLSPLANLKELVLVSVESRERRDALAKTLGVHNKIVQVGE